jgi:hypothetical protein
MKLTTKALLIGLTLAFSSSLFAQTGSRCAPGYTMQTINGKRFCLPLTQIAAAKILENQAANHELKTKLMEAELAYYKAKLDKEQVPRKAKTR